MSAKTGSTAPKYLYHDIVDEIRGMIRKGQLHAGDKLPGERTLARTFGVSRNCVRQAIQTLAERNILESRLGDGTYVSVPDRLIRVDTLPLAVRRKELLKDVIEFRLLLEPQVAYLAAARITPGELDRLKVLVCDQDRRVLAEEPDADLDAAFHGQLVKASRNRVLREVYEKMSDALNESRAEILRSDARKRSSVVGHLKIIDALEKKDPKGAFEAMREHLLAVDRVLFGEDGTIEPVSLSLPEGGSL